MSLTKFFARVWTVWCLIMGIDTVLKQTTLLSIIGWGLYYSLLAGASWYMAEGN